MLDKFIANVGEERLAVPAARGMTFYQVLVLASIVEREAQLDEEKPLIAGVYANRLNPKKWPRGTLESDPTDVLRPRHARAGEARGAATGPQYVFWAPIAGGLTDYQLPVEIAGYNTYTSKGLPPGPHRHADHDLDRCRA